MVGTKQVKSVCPYCGVGCGTVLTLEEGQIKKIEGDKTHPVNMGRLCTKGSTAHQVVAHPERLTHHWIRKKRGEAASPTSTEEAVSHVAAILKTLLEEHGPDAISFYVSGQMSLEAQYLVTKLAKGFIRTRYVESNSRLCMASASAGYKQSLGADAPPGSYEDMDCTHLFFVIGSNMADCHPILYLRMMDRIRQGAKLIVVDPRQTPMAEKADLFLQLKAGTDMALLNGLLHCLVKEQRIDRDFIENFTEGWAAMPAFLEPYTPAFVSYITGLAEHDICKAAQMIAEAPEWISCWTMGLNQSTSGTAHTNAICNLHLATGAICRPGSGPLSLTGQPNAMGGRDIGYMGAGLPGQRSALEAEDRAFVENMWGLPPSTLPTDGGEGTLGLFRQLRVGAIKACWIICTNPVASIPHRQLVQEALERADYVIVQDIFEKTETTPYADTLLAGALWAEGDGVMVNSDRTLTLATKALEPPGFALPDWQLIAKVAVAMGYGHAFSYTSSAEIFEEICQFWNPKTGYDLRGITYKDLQKGSAQWPASPQDDPHARGRIRYINNGHSQARCQAKGASAPQAPVWPRLNFATPSGKAVFHARPFVPPAERVDEAYPFILNTGRVQNQWHTATKTGKIEALNRLNPGPFIEVNPYDAKALGLKTGLKRGVDKGEMVQVISRRGKALLPLVISHRVKRGNCFVPFHWSDLFGEDMAINAVTNPAVDATSLQPELKYCAVNLLAVDPSSEQADDLSQPQPLKAVEMLEASPLAGQVVLLWASQTGKTEQLAYQCQAKLKDYGITVVLQRLGETILADLRAASCVLAMVSTFGDGAPPDAELPFWEEVEACKDTDYLLSLPVSVMAFGDRSYAQFCGFGKKLEKALHAMGAYLFIPHYESEHDDMQPVGQWLAEVIAALSGNISLLASNKKGRSESIKDKEGHHALKKNENGIACIRLDLGIQAPAVKRKTEFARLVKNARLNQQDSLKDTRHYIFHTAGLSLAYEAGDALGVVPENDPRLIATILSCLGFSAHDLVHVPGHEPMVLQEALAHHYEISRLSIDFLRFVCDHTKSGYLAQLLEEDNAEECRQWVWAHQIVDVLRTYPIKCTPQEWVDQLKPLQPRFYSIASSPLVAPEHIHLTVSTLRYYCKDELRGGVCSTFLADRAEKAKLFIQPSAHFRLPEDSERAVIMVGAGTGVAPFRAFLQERRARGDKGKNWLFFGEQHFHSDFYYRHEWEEYTQQGYLSCFDTAFSRDQGHKVYVQHRIMEKGAELWRWLQEGANFYICGDALHMAREVEGAFQSIIATYGHMSDEMAQAYLLNMQKEKRYMKDIY
ncbi:molybdopterin-dependent oxidoreductase [Entomobacter blattae]|uniref:assimilatory sulfite reductase (NADPH) n=1 Tax=Entomobacter blattae TaxID=2762277 RepID=A0A7H1NQE6_9PROT|nr:molybdopterin-dependent oxidoreductase [Entomobacter blattae]QNT78006.1 Nitrate reductase [Entomobacter blattae]